MNYIFDKDRFDREQKQLELDLADDASFGHWFIGADISFEGYERDCND